MVLMLLHPRLRPQARTEAPTRGCVGHWAKTVILVYEERGGVPGHALCSRSRVVYV